jgi:hypothetical protein
MDKSKKQSEAIKAELDKTNTRLGELQTQLTEQTAKFETAQAAFVSGRGKLEDSLAEQQKLTLLKQAVESLQINKRDLETRLSAELAAEARQDQLQQAKAYAEDAENALNEYTAQREALDSLLSEKITQLYETLGRLAGNKRKFRSLFTELGRDGDALGELMKSGLTQSAFHAANSDRKESQLKFGETIGVGLRVLENEERRQMAHARARASSERQADLRKASEAAAEAKSQRERDEQEEREAKARVQYNRDLALRRVAV